MTEETTNWDYTKNKYVNILEQYPTSETDDSLDAKAKQILAKYAAENHNKAVWEFLFSCIDLTSLKTTDNEEQILALTEKVNQFDSLFPELPHVAAICVYPNYAKIVSSALDNDEIAVACVSGGFPSSQTFSEVKIAETAMALHMGATEIDIVLPVGLLLNEDYEGLSDEISEIKELCGERTLKVILETGALPNCEAIKKAAILAIYSGADFIKTSTGKLEPAATPKAFLAMCEVIKAYYNQTGNRIGIKAAGGINTIEEAVNYYTIAHQVLGKAWMTPKLFRIGTSRLANQLLSAITGKEINHF